MKFLPYSNAAKRYRWTGKLSIIMIKSKYITLVTSVSFFVTSSNSSFNFLTCLLAFTAAASRLQTKTKQNWLLLYLPYFPWKTPVWRLKPAYSATETSKSLEILDIASICILSRGQSDLHLCSLHDIIRFSNDMARIILFMLTKNGLPSTFAAEQAVKYSLCFVLWRSPKNSYSMT